MDTPAWQLAGTLVEHSCRLQSGERVLIEAVGAPRNVVAAVARKAAEVGASPFVVLKEDAILRELALVQRPSDLQLIAESELTLLRSMDALIGIRAHRNCHELADLPEEKRRAVFEHYIRPVHCEYRNLHLRRVFVRWPTEAAAQAARMSTDAFTRLCLRASLIDYSALEEAARPLTQRVLHADKVHLVGPDDTDLTFAVTGIPAITMAGRQNIPDGEVQTSPVPGSLNGRIRYNVPSTYMGHFFPEIGFDFQDGKVVNVFGACDHEQAWSILHQDEGACCVGEFAVGINPALDRPIGDLLFDEKMWGSVHLAQGNAYQETDNANRSAVHWDLVLRQTAEAGGGEMRFDDETISRNGRFIVPDLLALNPENLLKRVLPEQMTSG
jgi:aminopeptidase